MSPRKNVDFAESMLPTLEEQLAVEKAAGQCRSTTTVLQALAVFVGTDLEDSEGMKLLSEAAERYARHEEQRL